MSVKYLQFCFLIGINLFLNVSYAIGLVKFKINPLIINKNEFDVINELTPLQWKEFAERGVAANNQEKRLEENLIRANIVVKNGSMSHVQLLDILPTFEDQLNSEVGDEILKSSLYIYNSICAPKHISGEHCESILREIVIPKDTLLSQKCLNISNERRNGHYPLRRLLPRHYKDGFYEMFNEDLPQPLSISQTLSKKFVSDENAYLDDGQRNLVLVQWSQFVANDLSNPVVTSMSNGYPIECCNAQNYKLMPRFHHPACEPLIKKDITNKYGRDTCLSYVRSALGIGNKCTFAAPDQLNQATAKLDLSQLYGFTDKSQKRMRSFKEGLLKSTTSRKLNDALLPIADEDAHWFCAREQYKNVNSSCFISGDSRVNNNPFAILIYTIMMRNHNRIAKELNVLHPDWTDEQLFQRAKSINIEIYRRIIFNEWLPLILGDSMANEIKRSANKLNTGNSNTEILYQVSNEYAVAASRFYLSMMPDKLTETNADERAKKNLFFLQNEIYSPSIKYTSSKLDDIFHSLLTQRAMKMDTLYVKSLIPNLEDSERPKHSDILAFDIQRGRDHGLQPYVKYLEICNNVKITSWKDLEKFIQAENLNQLKAVYTHWKDVDLIVGGISEISATNSTVGPTFQCIIGEQFAELQQYKQRESIEDDSDMAKFKYMTASDLLCLNSNLQHSSQNIFKVPSETINPMENCLERLNKFN